MVLYPHFQRAVVPGWLDKSLKWRHRSTHFLDGDHRASTSRSGGSAAQPELPDRTGFARYGRDLAAPGKGLGRPSPKSAAVREFAAWVAGNKPAAVIEPLWWLPKGVSIAAYGKFRL